MVIDHMKSARNNKMNVVRLDDTMDFLMLPLEKNTNLPLYEQLYKFLKNDIELVPE